MAILNSGHRRSIRYVARMEADEDGGRHVEFSTSPASHSPTSAGSPRPCRTGASRCWSGAQRQPKSTNTYATDARTY